jgi:hypothetical protein
MIDQQIAKQFKLPFEPSHLQPAHIMKATTSVATKKMTGNFVFKPPRLRLMRYINHPNPQQ